MRDLVEPLGAEGAAVFLDRAAAVWANRPQRLVMVVARAVSLQLLPGPHVVDWLFAWWGRWRCWRCWRCRCLPPLLLAPALAFFWRALHRVPAAPGASSPPPPPPHPRPRPRPPPPPTHHHHHPAGRPGWAGLEDARLAALAFEMLLEVVRKSAALVHEAAAAAGVLARQEERCRREIAGLVAHQREKAAEGKQVGAGRRGGVVGRGGRGGAPAAGAG